MRGMPKSKQPEIRLEADQKQNHADLYIFGVIGSWWDENTAEAVLSELQSYDNLSTIDVYLATIGGTFMDGLPIYNLLKNHKATVTVKVIGYALSMGSVIMLAGDKVQAAQNALIMIHNAQGVAWGNAAELRKGADKLDKHEQAIMPRYCERMNLSSDEVQTLLDEETWYTADEAKAAGLIDEIIDPVDLDDTDNKQPENSWRYAAENFRNPPDAFQSRVQNAMQEKPGWFAKLLKTAVGEPAPAINQDTPPDHEEEPVTKEDLDQIKSAIGTAVTTAVTAALEASQPPLNEQITEEKDDDAPEMVAKFDLDTVTAERDQAKADLATANAELAKLKQDHPDTTKTPENTGPVGDGWDSADYEG